MAGTTPTRPDYGVLERALGVDPNSLQGRTPSKKIDGGIDYTAKTTAGNPVDVQTQGEMGGEAVGVTVTPAGNPYESYRQDHTSITKQAGQVYSQINQGGHTDTAITDGGSTEYFSQKTPTDKLHAVPSNKAPAELAALQTKAVKAFKPGGP